MENMKLRANPFSRPYDEYFLRIDNGQKSFIINHFSLKAKVKP